MPRRPTLSTLRSPPLLLSLLVALSTCGCDPFGFDPEIIVCDILADTGCAETMTCINIQVPECIPAGKGVHGIACIKDEDCATHHLCVASSDGSRTCQRRCDLTKPASCKEMGVAENNAALKQASCLWATDNGARDLGYCSSPQCVPASNAGCSAEQKCIGGIEPRCAKVGDPQSVTVNGETVPYKTGEAALDAPCTGPGHCVVGGICATVSGGETRCVRGCRITEPGETGAGLEKCQTDFICKALTYTPVKGEKAQALPAGQGFCTLAHCNLVSNAGCNSGGKCIGTSSGTPACTLPGSTALLGECDQLSDCDAATTCVSGGAKALCVLKCDTTGALQGKSCPTGQQCSELKDKDGQPKPSHLGFCVPK